jgi:hypothetical protein
MNARRVAIVILVAVGVVLASYVLGGVSLR